MAEIKGQLIRDSSNLMEDSLADSGALGIKRMSDPDFVEGVTSFREGRMPDFAPLGGPNPAWPEADLRFFSPGPVAA
jgi:hypothetical protein